MELQFNIWDEWFNKYKPEILKHKRVPLLLVAEIFGYKQEETVRQMLRSNMYSFACATPCAGGKTKYDIFPLRFIAWYEGHMPQ